MNKKILIFSTAYYPFVGGAEVAVKEITDRLGADFEFDLITTQLDRKLPKQEKIGNIDVFRIGIGVKIIDKLLLTFYGHRMAIKLYRKNQYDIVWSIMASYGGLSASKFILKLKKRRLPKANGVPKFLLTLQEGDSPEHIARRARFIKKQFQNIFQRADYIQCISSYLADWAKKMGANCPIEVIPNGVDIQHFSQIYPEDELNELKRKLGKKNDDKFLITTSRLTAKNGIADLINSLNYLPSHIKLLIAGIGEDEKKLKQLTQIQNLENRIKFLGFIDHKEILKYLKISDIFIRPSLSEGLGNSFLEAMVAGIPVIATPIGGIPDFLEDGQTGLFCEVKNPESIARQVQRLLADTQLKNTITQNASQMVAQKYDWNLLAPKMQNIFEKLMG